MNITVTLTATPELLAAIMALVGGTQKAAAPAPLAAVKPEPQLSTLKEPKPAAKAAPAPVVDPLAATDQTDATELTMETVQELGRKKAMGGKKAKVKELLDSYGVAKITSVALDQLAEFYGKLQKI